MTDYKESGVNINEGNRAVSLIKQKVQSTFSPNVLQSIGHFAGLFELPTGYNEPVLVSCTDGVGTKLKLAIEANSLHTIGIDLVAMSVNDLICCGAKPLYFLDYIACNTLIPEDIDSIIEGIVSGCKEAKSALIGGEMAEMGNLYHKGDFDLAGFAVGIVEKKDIIDGQTINKNDTIYGIPSSGIHSNGYSLVRNVLSKDICEKYDITHEELLRPTRIYVDTIQTLITTYNISGIAHITGGGLVDNIERILPSKLSANIDFDSLPTQRIFNIIQEAGNIDTHEMRQVFNMGIGICLISKDDLSAEPDLIKIGQISTK